MSGRVRARGSLTDRAFHDAGAEARSPPGQWRLLTISLMCWAAASWAIFQPGRGAMIALGAGLVGMVLTIWACLTHLLLWPENTRPQSSLVSLLVLACAALLLIGTRIHLAEIPRADSLFQETASNGSQVTFEAKLTGFPELKRTSLGVRAWVHAEASSPSGSVPMLFWLSDVEAIPEHWGPGVPIEVTARLKAQPPQDAAAYTASPNRISEVNTTDLIEMTSARVGTSAAALRQALVQHASLVSGAELVPGFAVGDTSLVSERLSADMLNSSLTHLTAVSGSNTGLVIAAVVWSVTGLGAGRRLRIVLSACGLLTFVLIVGPDASVQRASVMAAVLLVGAFGGRRPAALPALGFAVLALLTLNPWQALQAGFSLSVAATGGILLGAAPITSWLRLRARIPRVLALPFAVALAAQLFCGPLILLLQPGIPAIGVVANVLAAPAAPLGTGIGLIATVLGPLSPFLAALAVKVASIPARWVAATADVTSDFPGGRWHWPEGWPGALLLTGCQVGIVLAWALINGKIGIPGVGRLEPRRPWQPVAHATSAIRVVALLLVSASLGTFFAATIFDPMAVRLSTPRDWVIVACDVGQGDALLVRDPKQTEEVMLIDTGDNSEALEDCLHMFGVTRISLLVLTHDDRDHVGALGSVLSRVEAALIAPTLRGEDTDQRPVVRALEEARVPYRIGLAGDGRSSESSGLSWHVLAPPSTALPTETNQASLVLLIQVEGNRLLMLADTGYEEHAQLMTLAQFSDVEVVKVAHHGSRDQDSALLERASATWGLISVGADNTYGHPTEETLAALVRSGTRTLRTDQQGSIALVIQPNGALKPWVERTAEADEQARLEVSRGS